MSEPGDPMYAEFDDVVRSPNPDTGPYVSSQKALTETRRLKGKHGLGFLFNPGGGAFTGGGMPDCQVSTNDDVEDLNRLRAHLRKHGREP